MQQTFHPPVFIKAYNECILSDPFDMIYFNDFYCAASVFPNQRGDRYINLPEPPLFLCLHIYTDLYIFSLAVSLKTTDLIFWQHLQQQKFLPIPPPPYPKIEHSSICFSVSHSSIFYFIPFYFLNWLKTVFRLRIQDLVVSFFDALVCANCGLEFEQLGD